MFCGSGGSKSRLAKAVGAEPSGQMTDEKLHAIVARSKFGSQNVGNTRVRTTFRSWDVEKVHAVVARSRCGSQNVQSAPFSEHFWKLRCQKSARHFPKSRCRKHLWKLRCWNSARRCGAKHMSKWKCMKMLKTPQARQGPFLDVALFCVAGARGSAPCQKWIKPYKTWGFCSSFMQFQKRWQAWDFWRGSAKLNSALQVQYKRHVHQRC